MFLLLLYIMKTIPEHPLSIKKETIALSNKLNPLLRDGYLKTNEFFVDLIEEVAYLNYVKDIEVRTFY